MGGQKVVHFFQGLRIFARSPQRFHLAQQNLFLGWFRRGGVTRGQRLGSGRCGELWGRRGYLLRLPPERRWEAERLPKLAPCSEKRACFGAKRKSG